MNKNLVEDLMVRAAKALYFVGVNVPQDPKGYGEYSRKHDALTDLCIALETIAEHEKQEAKDVQKVYADMVMSHGESIFAIMARNFGESEEDIRKRMLNAVEKEQEEQCLG